MARILNQIAAACLAAALVAASSPALAGDAVKGKAVFAAQCSVCHSPTQGGGTILGPNLFGVVGRHSASVPGFAYSTAMKAAGFTWSQDQLKAYLPSPKGLVPGTKMTFMGLKDPVKVDDLVAYLATLK
jgi:cytochrome c